MVKKRIAERTIYLQQEQGVFSAIFGRSKADSQAKNPDLAKLRSMFSPEKARILHVLKAKQPNSIYELAKILGRDFKSVRSDIKLLEELGFVEMIPVHKGNRQKLKPLLVIDELKISIAI